MSTEVNKRGVVLTVLILASICYILYSNSDELQSDSAIQGDLMFMNKAKEKFDKIDEMYAGESEEELDPEIGLEVEYIQDFVTVDNMNVFYSSAKSMVRDQPPPRFPVLLLHGAAYDTNAWKSLGTLQFIAKSGYYPIAVDLPGFGQTKSEKHSGNRAAFMKNLIKALPNTEKPVIICPSMSGMFALPFMFEHPTELRGIVPIAPVNKYSEDDYKNINVPALIYYGALDSLGEKTSLIMANMPNSKVVKVPNGGHPAYLDDLLLFHNEVKTFLDSVYEKEMPS